VRRGIHRCGAAQEWLLGRGYQVVRIGPPQDDLPARGVIDVSHSPHRSPTLELVILTRAAFVVCDSHETQLAAYLTNTPTLLLNARDPFSAYPVRNDGLFTLATPVDLDTGRIVAPGEELSAEFIRNLRRYGFRDNTADQNVAAVREMDDGLGGGWRDDDAQARFRTRATAAAVALAPDVATIAEWVGDDGFVGDGRLARWQAIVADEAPR
jgi:putative glycosyltransferase (TIGR04372 family)